MSVVVWGVEFGKCRPMAGEGFRHIFDTGAEADAFIQIQCGRVPRDHLDQYAMYITSEFCSVDRLMHYHNWLGSDAPYRDTDLKVEAVDILAIKNSIDLAYQAQKRREDTKKGEIIKEVNNMSREELQKQAQIMQDIGLI